MRMILLLLTWYAFEHCATIIELKKFQQANINKESIKSMTINPVTSSKISMNELKWNYLTFAQSWPPGFCLFNKCKMSTHSPEFSIHGLWPNLWSEKSISDCSGASKFNSTAIEDIIDDLKREWVDEKGHHFDFWNYEWQKHGTCAIQSGLMPDQHAYFSMALALKRELNITGIFKRNNLKPSKNTAYPTKMVLDILKTELGVDTKLQCEWHHNEAAELVEVRVCFDSNLHLIDCPTTVKPKLAVKNYLVADDHKRLTWTASCPDTFKISP